MPTLIEHFMETIDRTRTLKEQVGGNPKIKRFVDAYNRHAMRSGRLEMIDENEPGEKAIQLIEHLYPPDLAIINDNFKRYTTYDPIAREQMRFRRQMAKMAFGLVAFVIVFVLTIVGIYIYRNDVNPNETMLGAVVEQVVDLFKLVLEHT